MPSIGSACIYVRPSLVFAKLIKMQSPFAKPLDRYFLDFFANTRMQSLYAKWLGCSYMVSVDI
jgi:hypothetical protein